MSKLRSWGVWIVSGAVALIAAPAALAGPDPSSSVYSGVAGNVQNDIGSGALGASPAGGALPFTGLNLALIVLGGVALVAMGLVLRRRSATDR